MAGEGPWVNGEEGTGGARGWACSSQDREELGVYIYEAPSDHQGEPAGPHLGASEQIEKGTRLGHSLRAEDSTATGQ